MVLINMFRIRFRFVWLLVFLFIPVTLSFGFYYQRIPLQIKGKIRHVYFKKVNADNKPDLIVMHSVRGPEKYQRYLSVFLNRDASSPFIPDYTFEMSDQISFFDFAQLDAEQKGFFFLQSDGLFFYPWHQDSPGTEPVCLLSSVPCFSFVDPMRVLCHPMIFDLDQDSLSDVIIPGIQQIHIFRQDSTRNFQPPPNTPLMLASHINYSDPHSFCFSMPQIYVNNMHPQKGDELCVWTSHFLHTFSIENYQELQKVNTTCEILSGTYSQNKAKQTITPLLIDMNHDQYTDLLLSVKSPNYFPYSMNQMQVYLNKQGEFSDQPDQILSANNINGEYIFHDFNLDSTLDTGLLQMNIGLKEVIKFLLLGRLKAKMDIYCAGKGSQFPNKPNAHFAFEWRPSLMTIIGKKAFLLNLNGDYNGDGLKDFMVGVFPEHIQIYLGKSNGLFDETLYADIHLPLSNQYQQVDWDCNHKTDLVFWDENAKRNQLIWIQY